MGERYLRQLRIYTARDVVRYSFVAQTSITYLDLSVCEYGNGEKTVNTKVALSKLTDQKKIPLYNFHLDETIYRHSVRKFEALHPSQTYISKHLYTTGFCENFVEVVRKSSNKLQAVSRLLKPIRVMKLKESFEFMLILDCFLNILYSEQCKDSSLVVECVLTLGPNIKDWLIFEASPKLLDYVLQHTQKKLFYLWSDEELINPLSYCFYVMMTSSRVPFSTMLKKIYGLIKYGYTFQFYENENILYGILRIISFEKFIGNHQFVRFKERQSSNTKLRVFLLIPVLMVYFYKHDIPESLVELLRYFWNSIPHPYSSREEISRIFDLLIVEPQALYDLCEFYRKNVSDMSTDCFEMLQPRSLTHLCRICIRNRMRLAYELPYGIQTLQLPKRLKHYLGLEMNN